MTMVESSCPACGTVLVSFTSVPGDGAVCTQCRAVLLHDEDGGLVLPEGDVELELLARPRVQRAIVALARYHERFGPPMDQPHEEGRQ